MKDAEQVLSKNTLISLQTHYQRCLYHAGAFLNTYTCIDSCCAAEKVLCDDDSLTTVAVPMTARFPSTIFEPSRKCVTPVVINVEPHFFMCIYLCKFCIILVINTNYLLKKD